MPYLTTFRGTDWLINIKPIWRIRIQIFAKTDISERLRPYYQIRIYWLCKLQRSLQLKLGECIGPNAPPKYSHLYKKQDVISVSLSASIKRKVVWRLQDVYNSIWSVMVLAIQLELIATFHVTVTSIQNNVSAVIKISLLAVRMLVCNY